MTAIEAEHAPPVCPICRQPVCSLLHIRDRLVIPVYNAVVVPAVNAVITGIRRLCLVAAAVLVFAIVMGWTR